MTAAPIIVTARLGDADFAWLDEQRSAYFPAERNQLRAHLTMFHHLPPSIERELMTALKDEARDPAPRARLAGLINLGGGVAYRIDSDDLAAIRARLADRFAGCLTPQDAAGWREHVTIQNKVPPAEARKLLATLEAEFQPRPLAITGLSAYWYRGGPWEAIGSVRFRG
ncbi:Phosphoesterase HXTX domain-containing protein [Sphingomonas antarctica]|uniref:2'-5' RNA ligase family protein n=1 Tax=Sphingomonas antarctica TaxID=2040274 RepID=UPI0039ED56AE